MLTQEIKDTFTYDRRQQRIRELAYYKWIDEGCPVGQDIKFWMQAEEEYEAAERLIMGL